VALHINNDTRKNAISYNKKYFSKRISRVDSEVGYDRVARFYLVQNTKMGRNIPNGHKIFPMTI
jgi:hypothetical protein